MPNLCSLRLRWLLTALLALSLYTGWAQPRYYHTQPFQRFGLRFSGTAAVPSVVLTADTVGVYRQNHQGFVTSICDSAGNLRFSVRESHAGARLMDLFLNRFNRPLLYDGVRTFFQPRRGRYLFVPWPGRPRYTYAVALDWQPPITGQPGQESLMTYSVIDATARSDSGAVLLDSVDRLLHDQISISRENFNNCAVGMTVARHTNGRDLWLITCRWPDGFRVYPVTHARGLDRAHPVISPLPDGAGPTPFTVGSMLLSLNHRVLFNEVIVDSGGVSAGASRSAWYRFDAATGRIGAPHPTPNFIYRSRGWAAEFALSATGRYLYAAERGYTLILPRKIVRYDLRAGSVSAISTSREVVAQVAGEHPFEMLHTGQDGRLYALLRNSSLISDTVSVVRCPDSRDAADSFTLLGHRLPDYDGYNSGAAAPLYPSAFNDVLPVLRAPTAAVCVGTPAAFALTDAGAVDSARWTFGDNSAPQPGLAINHTYAQPGSYGVRAVYYYGECGRDTLSTSATVLPTPPAGLLAFRGDTTLCDTLHTGLILRAAPGLPAGLAVRWLPTGDTTRTLTVRQAGTYLLTTQLGACVSTDTVRVTVRACRGPLPVYILPNVITPDGDGRNDAFVVDEPGPWTLTVYSRWGRRVWQSGAAYRREWTGAGLSAGIYYYYLTAPDGRTYRGWVEVVP